MYDKIAECHDTLGNGSLALDYFLQSAEIRKVDPKYGLDNEQTKISIANAKRIAKELGKENDLPDWINEKFHPDELMNMFFYRKYDDLSNLFMNYYKTSESTFFNKDYTHGQVFENVWGFVDNNKPTLYTQ
jgi:hypothetical protein